MIIGMSSMTLFAQSNETHQQSEKVIRVKMVKNINGVETVFDTTIVGGEWSPADNEIVIPDIEIIIDSLPDGDHMQITKSQQLIIKTIDIEGPEGDSNVVIKVLAEGDPEMEIIKRQNGINSNDAKVEKHVIILEDDNGTKGKQKMEVRVTIKSCNIEDLNDDDKKLLKSGNRNYHNNLEIENVDFYPNPNNGRFNLKFDLPNEGDTGISIFNQDGKEVYKEYLPKFKGEYKNEIDISNQSSGVYYIQVNQGKNTMIKKMILQ